MCHTGELPAIARIKLINRNWTAVFRFSKRFWFQTKFLGGQTPVFPLSGRPCLQIHLCFFQNRRQQVFNRRALRLFGGIDIIKLTKTLLIYSVSRFNLGGLEVCLGGISPPNPPVATGLVSFHTAQKCVACRYHQPVTVLLHYLSRCLRSIAVLPQASLKNQSIHKKIH